MKTIYKYPIPPRNRDYQQWEDIETYIGAKFLLIAEVENKYYVWFEVDTSNQKGIIHLWIVGTGREVPENTVHLQSFISSFGYVWHVYGINKDDL